MAAISVRNLAKTYGDKRAVNDVSFEVDQGEVFALLGPNGAGKTTIIEILEGFRDRSAGQVETLGVDPADRRHPAVAADPHRRRPPRAGRRTLLLGAPGPDPQRRVLPLAPSGRRSHRPGRSHREGRCPGEDPFRRPAAPARRGSRHRRQSRAALPRRTHHRARPVRSSRLLGADPHTGVRGNDGAADHPLHGRGGGAGRSGGGAQQRPDRGHRDPGLSRWTGLGCGDHPFRSARRDRRQ